MDGLGSSTFWIIFVLFLWGCYHRAQHLKYKKTGPTSTAAIGEGFRVHYRQGHKTLTLDVPAAKTEGDALRYAYSKLAVKPDRVEKVEKL